MVSPFHRHSREALSGKQIKATENLLALSHTLKMMHLLNDHEAASAAQTRIRDERATQVEAKRQEAADLLKDLLAKSNEG